MSRLFIAALGLAAALAAGSAVAAPPLAGRVFYGDLDLSSARGAKEMLRRVHATAVELCHPNHSPLVSRQMRPSEVDQCVRAASDRAVGRLDAPVVTAAYRRIEPSRMAAAN